MKQLLLGEAVIPVVGRVRFAASDVGIAAVAFADWHDGLLIERWLDEGWTTTVGGNAVTRSFRDELAAYGARRLRRFTTKPDLRFLPPFLGQVLTCCQRIPTGRTATYADLAREAGNPRAVRAAGTAMRRNPAPLLVPCHRVLGSNGIGGYTPGLALKRAILAHEGVTLSDD